MVFPLFVIMSQPDSIAISVSISSELLVFSCVLVPVLFGILDPVFTRSGMGFGGIISLSSREQLVRPAIMMKRKTMIFMGISDQKVESYSMQEIRNYKIYLLFLIRRYFIIGDESSSNVDSNILLRKIANMTEGCFDFEVFSEEFFYGFSFCRGLNNNQIF